MLDDVPQRIAIYRVVGLPEIDKGHVQGRQNSSDSSIIVLGRRSGLHSHVPDRTRTGFH